MDDLRAQQIALAAAKEAVRETMTEVFALLGINIANFNDMSALRDDLALLRKLRTGASNAGARFILALITISAGAIAISLWETIKSWIHWHS